MTHLPIPIKDFWSAPSAREIVWCGVAAFLELDATLLGQWMLSRPSVLGSLLGLLIWGSRPEVWVAAQLGLWIELLLLDALPVGGTLPPNGALAAAGAVLLRARGVADPLCLFLGLGAGRLFSVLEGGLRLWRAGLVRCVEKSLERPQWTGAALWISVGISLGAQALVSFSFLVVGVVGLAPGWRWLWAAAPAVLRGSLQRSLDLAPWIGAAGLLYALRPHR